jgi:tRNA threonylcarbamoyladenosine biosynthesis protein TsaB
MPPTLLAIDTATEVCSVALAIGDQVMESSETVGHGHSERLLPMVSDLLRTGGRQLADCDAIAFGAGPGAFTGLRVACAVAQGLAFGAGKPLVAIGNLAALASAASAAHPSARRILVAIDARMQEVYWAPFLADGGAVSEIEPPALAAASDLKALCDGVDPDLVAGSALLAFPEQAGNLDRAIDADVRAGAAAVARLAVLGLARGAALSPEQVAPIYVRDRVAMTIDQRRAATAARR